MINAAITRSYDRLLGQAQWAEAHHIVHVRHEALDFRSEVQDLRSRTVTAVPGKLRAA